MTLKNNLSQFFWCHDVLLVNNIAYGHKAKRRLSFVYPLWNG